MTKQAVAAAALLLNAHSMAAGGTDSLTTYGLERVKGHHSMSEIDPFSTKDFFSQVELQLNKTSREEVLSSKRDRFVTFGEKSTKFKKSFLSFLPFGLRTLALSFDIQ